MLAIVFNLLPWGAVGGVDVRSIATGRSFSKDGERRLGEQLEEAVRGGRIAVLGSELRCTESVCYGYYMVFIVSDHVQELARRAASSGEVLRSTDDFDIFEMPKGQPLSRSAFLLWKEGKDFLPDRFPRCIFFPVTVGNRNGYIMSREIALALLPE